MAAVLCMAYRRILRPPCILRTQKLVFNALDLQLSMTGAGLLADRLVDANLQYYDIVVCVIQLPTLAHSNCVSSQLLIFETSVFC